MKKSNQESLHKRVNISLPNETLQLIDRAIPKGDRSRFLDNAVKFYLRGIAKSNLRRELREGAIIRSTRDLEIAEQWFNIDEEPWQKINKK